MKKEKFKCACFDYGCNMIHEDCKNCKIEYPDEHKQCYDKTRKSFKEYDKWRYEK